jgi:hypothetical protein
MSCSGWLQSSGAGCDWAEAAGSESNSMLRAAFGGDVAVFFRKTVAFSSRGIDQLSDQSPLCCVDMAGLHSALAVLAEISLTDVAVTLARGCV